MIALRHIIRVAIAQDSIAIPVPNVLFYDTIRRGLDAIVYDSAEYLAELYGVAPQTASEMRKWAIGKAEWTLSNRLHGEISFGINVVGGQFIVLGAQTRLPRNKHELLWKTHFGGMMAFKVAKDAMMLCDGANGEYTWMPIGSLKLDMRRSSLIVIVDATQSAWPFLSEWVAQQTDFAHLVERYIDKIYYILVGDKRNGLGVAIRGPVFTDKPEKVILAEDATSGEEVTELYGEAFRATNKVLDDIGAAHNPGSTQTRAIVLFPYDSVPEKQESYDWTEELTKVASRASFKPFVLPNFIVPTYFLYKFYSQMAGISHNTYNPIDLTGLSPEDMAWHGPTLSLEAILEKMFSPIPVIQVPQSFLGEEADDSKHGDYPFYLVKTTELVAPTIFMYKDMFFMNVVGLPPTSENTYKVVAEWTTGNSGFGLTQDPRKMVEYG